MILCNCIIEAENNFLLESIAVCDPDSVGADLEMYFIANMAFLNYFEGLIDILEVPFLHNVTTQHHILPISLESDDFDKELLAASETLKELVEYYKRKKLNFDRQLETLDPEDDLVIETSIFNHLASKIFYFHSGNNFVNNSFNSNYANIQRRKDVSIGNKFSNDKRCESTDRRD